MGMGWRNYPRCCFGLHVCLGVLMRNRYLDMPNLLQVIGAITLAIIGLSFVWVVFKITLGVILWGVSLL